MIQLKRAVNIGDGEMSEQLSFTPMLPSVTDSNVIFKVITNISDKKR